MISFEKIKYSRCPSCKKNGIKAFLKTSHGHNPILTCKWCGKNFSVNIALSILAKIIIPIFWGSVGLFLKIFNSKVSIWIFIIIAGLSFLIFEYFAPLEEEKQDHGK